MKKDAGKHIDSIRPQLLAALAPRFLSAACTRSRPTGGVIVHPTDYSEASRRAFELACRLASDRGSKLVVMHVAEPVSASLGMVSPPPLPKGYRGAWETRLRLIKPRDPAILVEHRLEEGDVADAILRVANEAKADLIVMAGREKAWLRRLLTESVSEKVERLAPCPLLRVNAAVPVAKATPSWMGLPSVRESQSTKGDH